MKVLFDHPMPFALAHGGVQVQIEQTKAGLEGLGLEVEWLRWWDATQQADLIHYFLPGRTDSIELARARGIPTVLTAVFSETCNRPAWRLALQRALVRAILACPGGSGIKRQLTWTAYRTSDHLVVGLEAEKAVLTRIHGIASSRVSVVPLGLSETLLQAGGERPEKKSGDHLICTGTITPVKRSLELAQLAQQTQVPVLFVGKPYDPADPYWLQFKALVDNQWVRYHAHVETEREMIQLLRAARGFVLYSRYENWSLSASEAAVCGLPLLLPDKPWSRERFGDAARYFGGGSHATTLQQFFRECPALPPPPAKLFSWREVAERLKGIYQGLVRNRARLNQALKAQSEI